ncbi:MAG TPA: hypothetical protein VNI01_02050 [Elusimicrobiota bacterium]|jgi:hypothetical protein|nr:hypothetical protein [Elusimicrobiota bacterium]
MNSPLFIFRALVADAVKLHLSATPYDGAALVLAEMAPCAPVTDAALLRLVVEAQASLSGAVAAFSELADHAPARARLATCRAALHAYHRASMAYCGVDVLAREVA